MSTQYIGNMEFDITGSLRSYDFTKRSVVNFNNVINSWQFEEMTSETIFRYLKDQMEIVSFGDYLKRYIYEGTEPQQPFLQLPEEYYVSVIAESFPANRAPHSFTPVKSGWGNIIRRWLRSDSVKRSSIFLLGFGLKMTDLDVSMFLTKVLKEQDFRFCDPTETVFWHCYHHGLPYSAALEFLDYYQSTEETVNDRFWTSVLNSLPAYLGNREKLKSYLAWLKTSHGDPQEDAFHEFMLLYERAVSAARTIKQREGRLSEKDQRLTGAYDLESILCSGTPRTSSKNLTSVTRSVLSRQFEKKRMSRQHLGRLLCRQAKVERFDIITLLFLAYAVNGEGATPAKRYMRYIDEANLILDRCGMMGLYPVNPYESFVLMCLLAEDPLCVYNDVWELSYEEPG